MKNRIIITAFSALFVLFIFSCSSGGYKYIIKTSQEGRDLGEIEIELYPQIAPQHVRNFDSLVAIGFYDGTAFHRVIPGFMIQGGDPNSKDQPREKWGFGQPGQRTVPAEFNKDSTHHRGIVSAARSADPNSATSQFFIMVADAPHLDGQYSIFGHVINGMNVVDTIVNMPRDSRDNPIKKVEMKIEKE